MDFKSIPGIDTHIIEMAKGLNSSKSFLNTGAILKFEAYVKEIIPRTYNVASFRFLRPEGLKYKPGQFLILTVKNKMGKELSKPFSLSSSPTEKEHIEFTKKFTDSEFSNALRALKVGDWVMVDAPYGRFTFEGESEKIVLLAGGIGITPFRSICKYCTDMQLSTKITLLYGNRSEEDIVFREELEALAKQNRNLKVIFILEKPSENWKGAVGIIDVALIKREVSDYEESVFYACGPPTMIQAMSQIIRDLGLPPTQLKLETFTGHT